MESLRELTESGGMLKLTVRAVFDDREVDMIDRLGLRSCRIKTADGPFGACTRCRGT